MTLPWQTLVQPDAVEAALQDEGVVVIDCRFSLADPNAGGRAYLEAHLPGARYAHLDHDLSGPHVAGAGRHPWPDTPAFAGKLSAWGVTSATQVVAYDGGDGAFAARLWCLLRTLGHRAVAVLDGGWQRWVQEGRRMDSDAPTVAPMHYGAAIFDDALLFDATRVQRHLDDDGLLLDARAAERFRGEVEPIDRIAGHVPGAFNRPYSDNLEGGRFKDAAILRREFGALLDGRPASEVAVMCGSGVTACHHLLAMAHAGLPGAKLFTGSWSGWIEDPTRPVATGH